MPQKAGFLSILLVIALSLTASASASAQEPDGNPWWLWIVVLVLLAAFVGAMLWWWMRSVAEEETPRTPAQPPPPALVPGPGAAASPDVTAMPERRPQEIESVPPATPAAADMEGAPSQADDLEIIEGIGPRIAGVLRDAGVYRFDQLASLEPERIKQLLRDRNPNLLRLADPATWPEQARLAAAGEWEALAQFQAGLKGGRRG